MNWRGPLAISGCMLLTAGIYMPRAPGTEELEDPVLEQIRIYGSWPELTTQPVLMGRETDWMCMPSYTPLEEADPHRSRFLRVFANEPLANAIRQKARPAPVGSIIVKQKLRPVSDERTEIDLLTVMVKREPGYNPESGDWEFMVISSDARTVLERGKLETCMGCHKDYAKRDFLTLTYLADYASDGSGVRETWPPSRR